MKLPSYPKVYAIGHRMICDLFDGPVVVQEKVDGSQFSFMVDPISNTLYMQSRGAEIYLDNVPKLFRPAVDYIVSQWHADHIEPGIVFRGEVISSRRHNVLTYDRLPAGYIVLFDAMVAPENYAWPAVTRGYAEAMGLEPVPTFKSLVISSFEKLVELTQNESFLGGTKVEGIVVKNYGRFSYDGKPMMGKYVREEYKEKHGIATRKNTSKGQVEDLVEALRTEARWEKAVQHLRDAGQLQEAPQDIGPLMKAVSEDVIAEESEWITERLWKWAWPQISRGITRGLAQWYKDRLAKQTFEGLGGDAPEPVNDSPCEGTDLRNE